MADSTVPLTASTPSGGPRRVVPVVAAAAVVVVAIVAGVVLATRSNGGDTPISADRTTTSISAGTADSLNDPVANTDAGNGDLADETVTTDPVPPTASILRTARLDAGEAVLRTGPSLGAGEVVRLSDRTAGPLEVLDEATQSSGWYRVRVDGREGWVFGAFVDPPGPGLCVATYRNVPDVSDISGNEVTAEKSGTKVLVIGNDGSEGYHVLLPGGQTGWVYAYDAVDTSCHEGGE